MTESKLNPNDLLTYNATYRILICRECQYAIQKSAVQSHLLRHKIYRDERQRLVFAIEQLDLLEPDDVVLPPAPTQPVDGLPVIPGFRCAVPGCNSLCASIKRMKRHQSDSHEAKELSNLNPAWDDVSLQTFFRGTKIKYFQVHTTSSIRTTTMASRSKRDPKRIPSRNERSRSSDLDDIMADVVIPWSGTGPQEDERNKSQSQPPSIQAPSIDLETLSYFNHFVTITSLTLPTAEDHKWYWQRDIVQIALQHDWLMSGVLAIAASHLAITSEDSPDARKHRERSIQFSSAFHAVWNKDNAEWLADYPSLKTSSDHVACMMQCSYWAMQDIVSYEMTPLELSMPFNLLDFLDIVRATAFIPTERGEDEQSEIFAEARKILDLLPKDHVETSPFLAAPAEIRLTLLHRIRTLTWRISETLGRPAAVSDVVATLAALSTLVISAEASFKADDAISIYRAMALWLVKVPDYFRSMTKQMDITPMVAIAHWTWLVRRAEDCGCWFLRGMSRRMFVIVDERLSEESTSVQDLIQGLRDGVL